MSKDIILLKTISAKRQFPTNLIQPSDNKTLPSKNIYENIFVQIKKYILESR